MHTPIDFGKDFLNKLFDERDAEACLKMLAGDLVWITPEDMHHFLTKNEVFLFLKMILKKKLSADAGPRYVDISSIRSSPSADEIMTVAYEVNLVSKEDEKEEPLYLRCSMVICRRNGRLEISFLHFSSKTEGGGVQQLHDFVANLPCGVMILACLDGQGEEAVFYNDYFARRLRYRPEAFAKKAKKNPFFMASEEDRQRLREEIRKARKNGGNLSVNLRFYRRDGNSFYYKMIGAPAWETDGGAMYYCVFQEITGYRLSADRLQAQLDTVSGILRQVPEGICVIEYPGEEKGGKPRVIFTSKNIPSMLGVSLSVYTKNILSDPFFGLEITSITREKLKESHLLNREKTAVGRPASCGVFRVTRDGDRADRKSDEKADAGKTGKSQEEAAPRIELVIRRTAEKNGEGRLYLFYYDCEAQQRETEERVDRAMRMGRAGQERLREQVEKTKEKAASAQKELEDALREEKEKNGKALSRLEELLVREKGNSALLSARLEESREALKKMAQELALSRENAARTLKNMLQKAREDAEREKMSLLQKAEEEAERRIREVRRKAEEEAEGRLQDAIQKAVKKAGEDSEGTSPDKPGVIKEEAKRGDPGEGQRPQGHRAAHISEAFSPEECIRDVVEAKKGNCEEKKISLELHFDSGMPASVTGFKSLFCGALDELMENALLRARAGGKIRIRCRSDRPSEGLVNLAFRIVDDGAPISEEKLRTLFRARPIPSWETEQEEGWLLVDSGADPQEKGLSGGTEAGRLSGFPERQEADPGPDPSRALSEEPDQDFHSGLFTAREAAALMGGSLHARSGEKDTRFLLNVALHVGTELFKGKTDGT